MDSVVDRYKKMALQEEEEEAASIPAVEEAAIGFPVIGQVLTDRKIRFSDLKEKMTSLWRPGKGMTMKEICDKRYLFSFNHRFDMQCVLDGGPWQFERSLIMLKELMSDDIPHKIILNEAEFWVQIHNESG
ncbi:unnamed protein product [Cuscuta epithymum]|uniref:DUF4283 domain-containing protein n=1 Tax=Cuscuta epithymum TaxID=186058 RepID=A0AAV0CCJ5_9ASTE|nr:unnamed protein product [Cuscuta epithymum]